MEVTVIIPVFNAAPFIRKAVESAFRQKQTKEIILVEDHSDDSTLEICKDLEKNYTKIKLFVNKRNLGAGASRNIGLKHSSYPYIAFLDADDFYSPGFFNSAEYLFNKHTDADAVFGSIGSYYYDNISKKKHLERTGRDNTGLNFEYHPDKGNLLSYLIQPGTGHFSIIATVFKKASIDKTGQFNEKLKQSQDTDFLWKFAFTNKLYALPSNNKVAFRGVHSDNRVLNTINYNVHQYLLLKIWVKNITLLNLPKNISLHILRRYLVCHPIIQKIERHSIIRIPLKIWILSVVFIQDTKLLFQLIC